MLIMRHYIGSRHYLYHLFNKGLCVSKNMAVFEFLVFNYLAFLNIERL